MADFSKNKSDEFSEYPSTIPNKMPYSGSVGFEYNPENPEKIIVCMYCRYRIESKIIAPICGVCNHAMVVMI